MNLLGNFYCFHWAVTLNDMLPVGTANLLHIKHDQAQYSIKPDQYGKKAWRSPWSFPRRGSHRQLLRQRFLLLRVLQGLWLAEHEVHGRVILGMRQRSHPEHLGTARGIWDRQLAHCFVGGAMRVQDADRLPGDSASFFGVSPFREIQNPMVDTRLDLSYKEAKDTLDEVDYGACMKYVARKMLAWYTKYPPKNDGAARAAAVEASAAPPPRTPRRPTVAPRPPMAPVRNVAWPPLMMRAKQPSNCWINGHWF
jgi:hypothetical protein